MSGRHKVISADLSDPIPSSLCFLFVLLQPASEWYPGNPRLLPSIDWADCRPRAVPVPHASPQLFLFSHANAAIASG